MTTTRITALSAALTAAMISSACDQDIAADSAPAPISDAEAAMLDLALQPGFVHEMIATGVAQAAAHEGCQAMVLDQDAHPMGLGAKAGSLMQGMPHICDMRPGELSTFPVIGNIQEASAEYAIDADVRCTADAMGQPVCTIDEVYSASGRAESRYIELSSMQLGQPELDGCMVLWTHDELVEVCHG